MAPSIPTSRADSANSLVWDFENFYSASCQPDVDQDDAVFHSIDSPEGLRHGLETVTGCGNRNFVVDFSDGHAWAGYDLGTAAVMALVKRGGWPGELSTRWIDISYPTRSKRLLEQLAYHYDFSPRLLAIMCSEPPDSSLSSDGSMRRSPSAASSGSSGGASQARRSINKDIEKMIQSIDHNSLSSTNPARTGNLYELLLQVWHYTSVDQGENYICLGYNSIYTTRGISLPPDQLPSQSRGPISDCIGAWTWLVLCGDRTVISINEDLFPRHHGRLSAQQKSILLRTKENAVHVFQSLSSAIDPTAAGFNRLPIRKRLVDDDTTAEDRAHDAPGLLFYFLFENWFNSYSLVTRRDSRYGEELQKIRSDMFEQPDLTQISRLDEVGNDLNVLKRHYKSYIRIIDRVTEISDGSGKASGLSNSEMTTQMVDADDEQGVSHPVNLRIGVDPGPAARVRFERLKDMITLYALSEVKDYLDKKQMLVDMNFSLIAIKESRDVERLTRVGLFITKATILFLPIELMTAYFGSNLSGQRYTVAQYWTAFACIFGASWVVLMGFGVVSGTMENWSFVSPLRMRLRKRVSDFVV